MCMHTRGVYSFIIFLHVGIAVGTEICTAESPALTDPTVWTFMIGNSFIQDFLLGRGSMNMIKFNTAVPRGMVACPPEDLRPLSLHFRSSLTKN